MRIRVKERFPIRSFILLSIALITVGNWPTRGCSVKSPIWMVHDKSADPLYRFVRNGKAGYINQDGKVVIEPKLPVYNGEFHEGLMQVGAGPFINTDGVAVIPEKERFQVWAFSEGLAAAREYGGKWGYIDHSGEFAINPQFDAFPNGLVSSFSDGLAAIMTAGKFGYIDHSGNFVIPPRYVFAAPFEEGLARVVINGPCSYFDSRPSACPSVSQIFPFGAQGDFSPCKFAFIDKSGRVLTDQEFYDAMGFSDGLAPVATKAGWGYIDTTGKIVIEPQFDLSYPFSDGRARVMQGGLYGYIDQSGSFIVEPKYRHAADFSDGLAVVDGSRDRSIPGPYFYINKEGHRSIPGEFVDASSFFKGLAHVQLDGTKFDQKKENTFAYIQTSGKIVFQYRAKYTD